MNAPRGPGAFTFGASLEGTSRATWRTLTPRSFAASWVVISSELDMRPTIAANLAHVKHRPRSGVFVSLPS